MKLCVRKIYCNNCKKLVHCQERKTDNEMLILCPQCKNFLWTWNGVRWMHLGGSPVKAEAVKAKPAKGEAARAKPAKKETPHARTAKTEAAGAKPAKKETAATRPVKTEGAPKAAKPEASPKTAKTEAAAVRAHKPATEHAAPAAPK